MVNKNLGVIVNFSIKKLSFLCLFAAFMSQPVFCERIIVLGFYNQFNLSAAGAADLDHASKSACTYNALSMANALLQNPATEITPDFINAILMQGAEIRNPHGDAAFPTIKEASQHSNFRHLARHESSHLMLTDHDFATQVLIQLLTDDGIARAFIVTIRNQTFLLYRYPRLHGQQQFLLFDSHGIAATSHGSDIHPAVAIICDNVDELMRVLQQDGFTFARPAETDNYSEADLMQEFQVSITPFDLNPK